MGEQQKSAAVVAIQEGNGLMSGRATEECNGSGHTAREWPNEWESILIR